MSKNVKKIVKYSIDRNGSFHFIDRIKIKVPYLISSNLGFQFSACFLPVLSLNLLTIKTILISNKTYVLIVMGKPMVNRIHLASR